MRLLLTILLISFQGLSSAAQPDTAEDTTVYTFIVKLIPYEYNCGGNPTDSKYMVIQSDFKFPLCSIYTPIYSPPYKDYRDSLLFKIRGRVYHKTVTVYGCFSSSRQDARIYVHPIVQLKYFINPEDSMKIE
jgi:hypothetical protein